MAFGRHGLSIEEAVPNHIFVVKQFIETVGVVAFAGSQKQHQSGR
jgi:hypothetical protein